MLNFAQTPPIQDIGHIRVITTIEEIEDIRPLWEHWQRHPSTTIDAFLESLQGDKTLACPFVMLAYLKNEPQCLLVGRILETKLEFNIGYFPLYRTQGRVLSILDKGVLGDVPEQCSELLIKAVMDRLAKGDADMAHLACLPIESPIYDKARTLPGFLFRSYVLTAEKRWSLHLAGDYKQFLDQLSAKSRNNAMRSRKKFENTFADRLEIRCVTQPKDLEIALAQVEQVAAKAWQRRMGTGFMNTEQELNLLRFMAKADSLSIDLLLVDGNPIAFCYGIHYQSVYLFLTPGYDPDYAEYRAGNYLLLRLIERLCAHPTISKIDFGIGDVQYKQVYSNLVFMESHVRIFAPTWKGFRLNAARSTSFLVTNILTAILKKLNIYKQIKQFARTWLNRS
jgi:Acetyltransferase (GNAT) domain